MKYCGECGKEIKEDAKFCPFCGAKQLGQTDQEEVSKTTNLDSNTGSQEAMTDEQPQIKTIRNETVQESQTESVAPQPSVESNQESLGNQPSATQPDQTTNTGFSAEQLKNNETVQQLSKNGKNYLNYLNKNIRKPKIGQNEAGLFGLINFILITLFSGLAISHAWSPLLQYGTSNASAFPYAIQLILWIGLSLFTSVLVIFVVSTQVYKRAMTFLEAFEWVFAPNSLSVYVSLFAFFMSFLVKGDSQIFYLFFMVPFVLTNISYMGSLWELPTKENQKNKFYITVLSVVVGAIIIFVVSRIFGGMIVEDFAKNNYLFNMMGGLF